MSYLLDTNVISELIRREPNLKVLEWIKSIPNEALYLSVLTLGEIRKGIEGMPQLERKEKLRIWLEVELPQWFEDRILFIDSAVADRWGRLQSEMKRPIAAIDSLLAATALHYDFRLVTRNAKDFTFPGLSVFNPWNPAL